MVFSSFCSWWKLLLITLSSKNTETQHTYHFWAQQQKRGNNNWKTTSYTVPHFTIINSKDSFFFVVDCTSSPALQHEINLALVVILCKTTIVFQCKRLNIIHWTLACDNNYSWLWQGKQRGLSAKFPIHYHHHLWRRALYDQLKWLELLNQISRPSNFFYKINIIMLLVTMTKNTGITMSIRVNPYQQGRNNVTQPIMTTAQRNINVKVIKHLPPR